MDNMKFLISPTVTLVIALVGGSMAYGALETRMSHVESTLAKHSSLDHHPQTGEELATLKAEVSAMHEDVRDIKDILKQQSRP